MKSLTIYTGLYGLLRFHEITNDPYALDVALKWFEDRFAVGTTKNVNTMSPLLTAAYLHESKLANYKVRDNHLSTDESDIETKVHLESWAEWVMHDMLRTNEDGLQHATYLTLNDQQLWGTFLF